MENIVIIEIAILIGLAVNAYLAWKVMEDVDRIEEVLVEMLCELGEQGILKVEVTKDD
jgi:hypothetical protein